jgi:phospholipid/cholesterol/gamma-HCH transport system substrate-binding protein
METKASHIAVGAFVLLLIVSGISFIVWINKFSERGIVVDHYIRFAGSVAGLNVGSNVLFGGIPIGHVMAVRVDPQDSSLARVDIAVDSEAPIRRDSEATLAMQGITGNVLVEISRGTEGSPRLKPGEEIRSGYSPLERLLTTAPEMLSKANQLLDRATAFLNPQNAATTARILDNLDQLTAKFSANTGKLDTLLTDGSVAVKQITATSAEVQKLATDLRGTTGKLVGDADKTVQQIHVLASSFTKTADKLNHLIDDNRQPVHDFASTGLYELSQMITEVRMLAQNLNRISMEIERDPARFFFGDRQKGFQAQ